MQPLNMTSILMQTYELADLIRCSSEMRDFVEAQAGLVQDPAAQQLLARLNQVKREYEEVQRFSSYHPDARRVEAEYAALRNRLEKMESVTRYRQAEDRLEKMLYHVSRTLARSVSHTVKVPRHRDDELAVSGCGSGGGCGNCGSGGG